MACGLPFASFIEALGHDGSGLPYKDTAFRAGFHPQECIEVAQILGWACTPIELFPKITPNYVEERIISFKNGNWARFLRHLNLCTRGVIEGYSPRKNLGHAVAWDGILIYDPRGRTFSFSEHIQFDFIPRVLWKVTRQLC
jgi:hypothetical protein